MLCPGKRPLWFLVTSILRPIYVHPIRSLVISVLGQFGPKQRTDLATSVLMKPKLSHCICICKVSLRCMFITDPKMQLYHTHRRVTESYWHFITKKETRTDNGDPTLCILRGLSALYYLQWSRGTGSVISWWSHGKRAGRCQSPSRVQKQSPW